MGPRMRRRITSAKREEIEKEQKILDATIVRPFETMEGLPISYKQPSYGQYDEVLKNTLTIKDSGVLYNSLIRSRNTYVYHAPMFKLYWVKQTAYAKKLAEMEKEKEVVRDRESRRRFAKATSNSLETKTRTSVLSADVNARDVMSKLCESSLTVGPHYMEIRIFIAKDARSEKSKAFAEISRVSDAEVLKEAEKKQLANSELNSGTPPFGQPQPPLAPPSGFPPAPVPAASLAGSHTLGTPSAGPSASPTEPTLPASYTGPPGAVSPGLVPSLSSTNLSSGPAQSIPESSISDSKIVEGKTVSVTTDVPQTAEIPAQIESVPSKSIETNQHSVTVEEKPASLLPPPTVSEETPSEPKKIGPTGIATSNAPPSQPSGLRVTQAYSLLTPENAPTVKPTVDGVSAAPANSEVPSATPSNGAPDSQVAPVPRPPPPPQANLQSIDNLIMISNLSAIGKVDLFLNDLMKVVALGSASESQVTLFKKYIERAKQMGPQPHHAELYFSRGLPLPPNFPGAYPARPFVERKPPRVKIPNPMKLTAFQEKYLHNATLVFEFLENPNVRYVIPRDSICEVFDAETPPKDAEEGSEFKDVLISTIWIHNIDELEAYEKKLAEYNAEQKKIQEEEAQKKKELEKAEEQLKKDPAPSEERNLRAGTKKKAPPPKKKKLLECPEEPNIKFTTYSFTLHNIPARFVPIVTNSMKPQTQVQERMEHILKNGSRVSGFYLWYQVDARLDEGVAEDLRNMLVQEEKKMPGLMPQGASVDRNKRKPREFKNSKPKRTKELAETPGSIKLEY